MNLFDRIVTLLPARFQPFAKAIVPACATLAGVLVSWAVTGSLDLDELKVGAVALLTAAATFLTPNKG